MGNTALSFDTLQYAKKLKEVGVSEQQAEVQAEAMKHQSDTILEFFDQNFSTKNDLIQMEERLTYKLTVRFGSMMVGGVVFLSALITIMKFL